MFKIIRPPTFGSKVKGIFSLPIPYEDRLKEETWDLYFGHYQPQRYGRWDSSSCWCLSAINCLEDQLEFLWKKGLFGDEAKKFFTDYGFIDADGDFSLSERFLEILSGETDTGGTADEAWTLIETYGCIPRSMCTYSVEQANQWLTQQAFDQEYFNVSVVTQEMKDIGQKFLKYVNIAHQQIGKLWETPDPALLKTFILQAPPQIGVPVPDDGSWNQTKVKWNGSRQVRHEVELWKYDDIASPDYPYFIYDQYHPELKQLSKDYYIPFCHQGVATVKQIVSPVKIEKTVWQKVWESVAQYFADHYMIIKLGRTYETSVI